MKETINGRKYIAHRLNPRNVIEADPINKQAQKEGNFNPWESTHSMNMLIERIIKQNGFQVLKY